MVVNFVISSNSNIESRRRIRRYTDIIVFVFVPICAFCPVSQYAIWCSKDNWLEVASVVMDVRGEVRINSRSIGNPDWNALSWIWPEVLPCLLDAADALLQEAVLCVLGLGRRWGRRRGRWLRRRRGLWRCGGSSSRRLHGDLKPNMQWLPVRVLLIFIVLATLDLVLVLMVGS